MWLAFWFVRVIVGPVSSASALAWIGFAREIVDDLAAGLEGDTWSRPDLIETFGSYLDEWEAAARRRSGFRWEKDIPTEQVEYHVHSFHQVVVHLADQAERTGTRRAPLEGDEFYSALVEGILVALAEEGEASAHFAEYLASFWPRRDVRTGRMT